MRNLTKMLAFGGVILAIFLMTIVRSNAAPGAAQPPKTTITPKITATLPFPTKTPRFVPSLPTGKRPPQCTFPLAQTTMAESTPEKYTFSEPKIVLTAEATIGLVEWLPDNQWVLITQDFRGNTLQNIELFNPRTGILQLYAKRNKIDQSPIWVNRLNAVLYQDIKVLKVNKNNGTDRPSVEFRRQLWISRGDPQNAQLIEDAFLTGNFLSYFSVGIEPEGEQIIYYTHNNQRLSKRNGTFEIQQSIYLDISQWEYRLMGSGMPIFYKMAWRPNSSQVFLYSLGEAGGYTFLLDTDTGQICEINLGNTGSENAWADMARWSPDGKYLAVIRTWGSRPVDSSDLAVLDTTTGKLYIVRIVPSTVEGLYFVNDVAWAPDSYHLAAIAQVLVQDPTLHTYYKISHLYLVDFLSNQIIQISSPSNEQLGSGLGSTNLIWSSNGSQLLVKCPTTQVDRLCLLSVQRAAQK
jgi:Tol biopolymer transport system component